MERFNNPQEALESVHGFLYGDYWPSHLSAGDTFTIIADDLDDRDREVPLTIKVISREAIQLETVSQIPNQYPIRNDDRWIDQTYRTTVRAQDHRLAFRALLAMAMAFRIDLNAGDYDRQRALQKTRSPRLRAVYRLLDHLPWLKTLDGNNGRYAISGDSSPWPTEPNRCQLGVLITPLNDTWLTIGYPSARIRHGFGGGRNPFTYSALYILAEAIRLENEGG